MGIAGEHDLRGTNAAGGCNDALADSGGIKRNRGRIFEYARSGFFGQRRQAKRIVKGIDVESLPIVHGIEIMQAV